MQSEDPRHGRRFRAPRAPQPSTRARPRRGDGGRPFEDQSPGSCHSLGRIRRATASRDQRGPDRRRPQHPRLVASCSFQRSTTAFASARASASARPWRKYSPSPVSKAKPATISRATEIGQRPPTFRHCSTFSAPFSSALYTPVGGSEPVRGGVHGDVGASDNDNEPWSEMEIADF